jgi:hypothetical protein
VAGAVEGLVFREYSWEDGGSSRRAGPIRAELHGMWVSRAQLHLEFETLLVRFWRERRQSLHNQERKGAAVLRLYDR